MTILFLKSDDLTGLTKSSTIIPDFKTDHSGIEFTFIIVGKARGPVYSRYDNILLQDMTQNTSSRSRIRFNKLSKINQTQIMTSYLTSSNVI